MVRLIVSKNAGRQVCKMEDCPRKESKKAIEQFGKKLGTEELRRLKNRMQECKIIIIQLNKQGKCKSACAQEPKTQASKKEQIKPLRKQPSTQLKGKNACW